VSPAREEDATEAQAAVEPEIVAEVMQEATQRLRDQAWKINALTQTPLIDETALTEDVSEPAAPAD
jgi:hypothetical protein